MSKGDASNELEPENDESDFAGRLDGLVDAAVVAGAVALGGLGFAAGGLAALPGLAFIEAPQNGQSTASSSRTDCLHDGQVGNMHIHLDKMEAEGLCPLGSSITEGT